MKKINKGFYRYIYKLYKMHLPGFLIKPLFLSALALAFSETSASDLNTLETECDNAKAKSCSNLAKHYFYKEEHDSDDYEKAISYFDKACLLKDYKACESIGYAYRNGKVVKKDIKKAVDYYDKACDFGSRRMCAILAYWYQEGVYVQKDFNKLKKYEYKSCTLGDNDFCMGYAHTVFIKLKSEKDYKAAFDILKQKCEQENIKEACNNAGYALANGAVTNKKDLKKARSYYKKACDMKLPLGCENLKNTKGF